MLSVLGILMTFEIILLVVSFPFKMCLNPIQVKYNDNYKKYRGVLIHAYNKVQMLPCGKCFQCAERKIEEWQIRWQNQLSESVPDSSYMLTLTYNDDNLPELLTPDGEIISTLDYTDVQKFLKRLRKRQNKICTTLKISNPKIYYHVCGEYGKRYTKRPHYHMLITNCIVPACELESIWKKGIVHVGTDVTEKTIKYVLKYTLKNSLTNSAAKQKVYEEVKTIVKGKAFEMRYPIEIYNKLGVITHNPDFTETEVIKKKLKFIYYLNGENKYRVAEKTMCSKGIGKNWLTDENIKFYRQNPALNYAYYDAKKEKYKYKPLPRYYKEEIYNPKKRMYPAGYRVINDNGNPVSLWSPLDADYENTPRFKKQLVQFQREQDRQKQLSNILLIFGEKQLYKVREGKKRLNELSIQDFDNHAILQDDKNYKLGVAHLI